MRKVIMFNMITADGYFEGEGQDISWHNAGDEEFNQLARAQLDSVDAILFGRLTYEMMASYWPTPAGIQDDPIVAEKMNSKEKIVFSNSLKNAGWSNTRLVRGDIAAEIKRLKQQPGKDLIIFGSSDLSASLAQQGLIDEYRIVVNPRFLGKGKTLLQGIPKRLDLKLLSTRTMKNGNVILYYQPAGEG